MGSESGSKLEPANYELTAPTQSVSPYIFIFLKYSFIILFSLSEETYYYMHRAMYEKLKNLIVSFDIWLKSVQIR